MKRLLFLAAALWLLTSAASAEWIVGDGYKMHWPQLPDPYGWDIDVVAPNVVTDDWLCTESGPVKGIHVWFSVQRDGDLDPQQVIESVESCSVYIYADSMGLGGGDVDNNKSNTPGQLLWQSSPENIEFAGPFPGDQGWASPADGIWLVPDHSLYFQANFPNIPDTFLQEEGETYWLALSLQMQDGYDGPHIGWKTTFQMKRKPGGWNNDAVYWVDDAGGGHWEQLWEYGNVGGTSLDVAFVITPEPPTVMMLLALAAAALLAFFRRRAHAP